MLWNVPDEELIQSIDFRDSPHRDGNVNYIDFDDDFVFLNGVGAKSVSVYSRRTGRQFGTWASISPPAGRLQHHGGYSVLHRLH